MDTDNDKPLIIDSARGQRRTYGELAEVLKGPRIPVIRWLRPRGLAETCFGVASALVAGAEVTLLDEDFSEAELGALGVDPAAVGIPSERSLPAGEGARLADRLAGVLGGSEARVTLYTSGSTGLPKAVTHSVAGLTRALRVGDGHAGDVWGFAYNPTHIAGIQVMFQALFNGNPMVNLFQLPGDAVREQIREHGVTHLSATPSFYRLMLPVGEPLTGVRSVTLGGERSDASLLGRLRELFPNARFRNLYASTEAGTLLAADGDVFEIPARLGGLIRLQEGRLEVHRELLGEFPGARIGADGWYATGDVVEVVSEAPLRFRIVSRDRDWINVGGNKVNPSEVEAVLASHPAVREARVFGRANSVLGNLVCAEVVPVGAAPTEPELRTYLGARLQAFKVPRMIRMVSELGRTRTGKLKRDE